VLVHEAQVTTRLIAFVDYFNCLFDCAVMADRRLTGAVAGGPQQQQQAAPATEQINFTVVYCTSSDEGYPPTELENRSPKTKGWLSAR